MKLGFHSNFEGEFVQLNGRKMIIKRTMKFEMPNLKRCKLEESNGEDYPYLVNKKKRRTNGYSCVNGEVEDISSGSGSLFNDESFWAGEVESNLKRSNGRLALNGSSKGFRRSSRGRVQILPSRFNDSVLSIWKNEAKFDETDTSFEEEDVDEVFVKEDRERIDELRFARQYKEDKNTFVNSKLSPDAEVKNFDSRKYIGSECDGNSFPRMGTEEYTHGLSFPVLERVRKANTGKRKEIYRPEDFALGDIVWAKCGRSYPAWPAVVIDPILQAPEAVLSCCIPGAICVMFFGFSKNGKQRVRLSPSIFSPWGMLHLFWNLSEHCFAGLWMGEARNNIPLYEIHRQVSSEPVLGEI